jgi:hypothetical protein
MVRDWVLKMMIGVPPDVAGLARVVARQGLVDHRTGRLLADAGEIAAIATWRLRDGTDLSLCSYEPRAEFRALEAYLRENAVPWVRLAWIAPTKLAVHTFDGARRFNLEADNRLVATVPEAALRAAAADPDPGAARQALERAVEAVRKGPRWFQPSLDYWEPEAPPPAAP